MHQIALKHCICGILAATLSLITIISANADVRTPLFTTETISIHQPSLNKTHKYVVEIAENEAQREHGLKFRSSLKDDYGMLFLFPHVNVIYMWMQDTYIPLDMIFLNSKNYMMKIKLQKSIMKNHYIILL